MRAIGAALLLLLVLGGCAKNKDAALTNTSTTNAAHATSTVPGAGTTGAPTTATTDHAHADMNTTSTAFSRAKATGKVDLQLVDFSYVGMPAQVTGPTVFFTASNKGPSDHEIELTDQDGKVVGAVKPFPQGGTRDLAVELQPGTYVIQCLVKRGDQTHAQLGMKNTFVVN